MTETLSAPISRGDLLAGPGSSPELARSYDEILRWVVANASVRTVVTVLEEQRLVTTDMWVGGGTVVAHARSPEPSPAWVGPAAALQTMVGACVGVGERPPPRDLEMISFARTDLRAGLPPGFSGWWSVDLELDDHSDRLVGGIRSLDGCLMVVEPMEGDDHVAIGAPVEVIEMWRRLSVLSIVVDGIADRPEEIRGS